MKKEIITIDESFMFDDDVLEYKKEVIREESKKEPLVQVKEMTLCANICIEFYDNGDIEDIYIDYKKLIAHLYVADTKENRLCSYNLLEKLENSDE